MWNIPLVPVPPLNNHQRAPTQTKQTASSAKTLPNANSPNTFTLQPSAPSSPPSLPPSTTATSLHGPVFLRSLISKHLPMSTFIVKGHLDKEQKNIRSTRSHQDPRDDIHPKQDQHSNNIITAIINTNPETSKSYSDQTGRFPILSSRGNQYILVLYHYDTNSIHAQLLKNRQALEITKA